VPDRGPHGVEFLAPKLQRDRLVMRSNQFHQATTVIQPPHGVDGLVLAAVSTPDRF
jgi:hypothetical protein